MNDAGMRMKRRKRELTRSGPNVSMSEMERDTEYGKFISVLLFDFGMKNDLKLISMQNCMHPTTGN